MSMTRTRLPAVTAIAAVTAAMALRLAGAATPARSVTPAEVGPAHPAQTQTCAITTLDGWRRSRSWVGVSDSSSRRTPTDGGGWRVLPTHGNISSVNQRIPSIPSRG